MLCERNGFFGEHNYRRKDGTVLAVEISKTMTPYKGREVVYAIARDPTEQAVVALERRNGTAHDIADA